MYLHLGQDVIVTHTSVIGIFNMDTSTYSKHSKDFLRKAEKNGKIKNISEDLPKSFVVCDEGGRYIIYISQISAATLLKRFNNTLLEN